MRVRVYLLYPFDLGLELDFRKTDIQNFIQQVSHRTLTRISFGQQIFSEGEILINFYRFGVGLAQVSFIFDGDIRELADLSFSLENLRIGKTNVLSYLNSLTDGLIKQAQKFAVYRYEQRLTEEEIFPVFVLTEPPAENAAEFINKQQRVIFGILSGEKDYSAVSDFILNQAQLTNFGYYGEEIILIKRFGALVYSADSQLILDIIKLALAQYWSLKSYNLIMDYELDEAQQLLEKLPPYYKFWKMPFAYQKFSEESLSFDRDKITILDSLYNVVGNIPAVENDWHLKTLHANVNKVFDLEELHKMVETKISRLEESYNSARDYLSTNFFLLLDLIFFLSLAWSVLDTFLLWKVARK